MLLQKQSMAGVYWEGSTFHMASIRRQTTPIAREIIFARCPLAASIARFAGLQKMHRVWISSQSVGWAGLITRKEITAAVNV